MSIVGAFYDGKHIKKKQDEHKSEEVAVRANFDQSEKRRPYGH